MIEIQRVEKGKGDIKQMQPKMEKESSNNIHE